jgi:hypothetical protein
MMPAISAGLGFIASGNLGLTTEFARYSQSAKRLATFRRKNIGLTY